MEQEGIRGRFLPSRVYARWRWTVRSGLLLVPLGVFLTGGVLLYLSPNKYRSGSLVDVENGPAIPEAVALMVSSPVLSRAIADLELHDRLGMDTETLVSVIAENTKVRSVPETGFIRITVSQTQKDLARDLADAIPRALVSYLREVAEKGGAEKSGEFDRLIDEAEVIASEKAATLSSLERVHGTAPETDSVTPIERARRASIVADAEVERLRVLKNSLETELLASKPGLVVHETAKIPNTPYHPEIGKGLNESVVRSLAAGLLTALLLPYFFELAFPPRNRRREDPAAAAF